jgi:hypothetical protein
MRKLVILAVVATMMIAGCGTDDTPAPATPPKAATGSCCASQGSCTLTTQADCSAAWTEDGACSPNPCPQPPPTYDADFGCNANGRSQLYENLRVAWGDMHSHTAYSQDALEREGCTRNPAEAVAVARDDEHLDFAAITDHAESGPPGYYTQVKWDSMLVQEQAAAGIVIFPGFEYTKTVRPLESKRGNGHKNIICRDFDHLPPRGEGFDEHNLPNQLWSWLDTTPAANNYICIPHHPAKDSDYDNPGISMATDWSSEFVDAQIQPLVEIYSRHGSSEMPDCEEPVNGFDDDRTVESALKMWLTTRSAGYKLGIMASTDTHYGSPGHTVDSGENVDSRLGYWTGGLTGVWVASVERGAIWNSLKAKNCTATTGSRTELEFTIQCDGTLGPMGATITHTASFADAPVPVYLHIRARTADAATIARVQIFRNGAVLSDQTNAGWTEEAHVDYRDTLDREYTFYRVKVWQTSGNTLPENVSFERTWSSPIWIERL